MTSYSSNLPSKPLRIGIDCRLWSQTGVGRYIQNLVSELLELDNKNEYVLFVRPQDAPKIELITKNSKFAICKTDIHWHSMREQLEFPKLLNQENLDLMHFTYFSVPIFYNRPFVLTIHDLIIHLFTTGRASTLPFPLYYMKRFVYKRVVAQSAKRSKTLIVPLNAVKEDVVNILDVPEEKIVVTQEGFDVSLKKYNLSKQAIISGKYFLYVGNAYPHKNLEMLIAAFQDFIEKTKSGIKLVLAGKKDFFYKRLQKEFLKHTKNNVVFLLDQDDASLANLYLHAQALVSASLAEGFGLTPLEALSFSCLPVLSNIPSFREVCQDAALYFNPRRKESIVNAFLKVTIMTKADKQKYLKRGKERLKQFSWKKMAAQTLKVYEGCTGV